MTDYKNPRLRVAIIALDEASRVLLLQHTRPHGVYWVLPGGGVEPGETLDEALRREIREELSAESEINSLAAVGELIEPDRHVVDFFYTGKITSKSDFIRLLEEGITDVGWFGLDEITGLDVRPVEIVGVITESMNRQPGEKCGIPYLGRYKNKT